MLATCFSNVLYMKLSWEEEFVIFFLASLSSSRGLFLVLEEMLEQRCFQGKGLLPDSPKWRIPAANWHPARIHQDLELLVWDLLLKGERLALVNLKCPCRHRTCTLCMLAGSCFSSVQGLDELLLFSLTPESAPSGLCLLMTGRPPAQTGDTAAVGFTHTLQSRPVNRSAVWNLMRHVFLSHPEMLFLMSPCDFGEENTAAIFPIKPFSACRASHDRNKECLSLWRCVCVVYVHVSVSATLSFSLCSPLCRNCFHGCFSDVLPSSDHLPCCVRWSFNQPLQVHQTH